MFQRLPQQATNKTDTFCKGSETSDNSDNTTATSPRPKLKTARSTGWSWPRLVSLADQSSSNSGTKTPKRIRNKSASGSLRDSHSKRSDMPDVKEEVEAETESPGARSPSTEGSVAGESTHTMTQRATGDSGVNATAPGHPSEGSSVSGSVIAQDESTGRFANAEHDTDGSIVPASDIESHASPLIRAESRSSAAKVVVNRRTSITFEANSPLPPPRITVQHPSEASEINGATAKTAVLRSTTEERRMSHQQAREAVGREIAEEIARVSPRPTEIQDMNTARTLKPKKSAIALRKTRNACVRRTFLKMVLGRELAGPAKEALRKQARGEPISVGDLSV